MKEKWYKGIIAGLLVITIILSILLYMCFKTFKDIKDTIKDMIKPPKEAAEEETVEKTTEETTKEPTEEPTEETLTEETEEKTTKEEITDKEITGVLGKATNYAGKQEKNGIEIEIIRAGFFDKSFIEDELGEKFPEEFDNVKTVGEIIVGIANNSKQMISIYPDRGPVIVGDEQINPYDDYYFRLLDLEDITDDIYPGVKRIGGFWFGVNRTNWDEITEVTYVINRIYDKEGYGMDLEFSFDINFTGKGFEPLPEILEK